jgi:probable rRNA maturation factor
VITFRNAQRKVRVATDELQDFAARALPLCLREASPTKSVLQTLDEVTAVLISDRRIAALHKQFMNITGATDVITFDHGDIFISTETAQRQAREFRTSTESEIKLYLIHGLLHLHGFNDLDVAARTDMEAVQTRIFQAATSR